MPRCERGHRARGSAPGAREAAPAVSRLGLLGLGLDLELDEGGQADGEGCAGALEGEAAEGAGDGPAEAGEGGAEGLGSGHVSVS